MNIPLPHSMDCLLFILDMLVKSEALFDGEEEEDRAKEKDQDGGVEVAIEEQAVLIGEHT